VLAAVVIFALTYLAIAAGRFPFLSVDRPAAALLGAELMVAARVLTPDEAGRAVNGETLGLLLGMMILSAYLAEAGFLLGFEQAWTALFAPALGQTAPRQAVVFGLFSAGASQVVSNVPFVILAQTWIPRLSDPTLLWLATALASTLAGNLTVIGSVANLIVLELAGPKGRVSFLGFLRYGSVVTGATLVLGLGILLAERAMGWL